jgi:magnesium chelatase family protein
LGRISGPLLDRLDLHVMVPAVDLKSWSTPTRSTQPLDSKNARALVRRARQMQKSRFLGQKTKARQNSLLSLQELEKVAEPDSDGKKLMGRAIEKNILSARGYVRVLRVARTLADLEGEERPSAAHVAEALRYRISDLSQI